jgi:hypothetical protein
MEIKSLATWIRCSLKEPKSHTLIPKSVNNSKYWSFLDICLPLPSDLSLQFYPLRSLKGFHKSLTKAHTACSIRCPKIRRTFADILQSFNVRSILLNEVLNCWDYVVLYNLTVFILMALIANCVLTKKNKIWIPSKAKNTVKQGIFEPLRKCILYFNKLVGRSLI